MRPVARFFVERFGSDPNGRETIAWGRRQFRMLNAEC